MLEGYLLRRVGEDSVTLTFNAAGNVESSCPYTQAYHRFAMGDYCSIWAHDQSSANTHKKPSNLQEDDYFWYMTATALDVQDDST